jgi:hypothetical protein
MGVEFHELHPLFRGLDLGICWIHAGFYQLLLSEGLVGLAVEFGNFLSQLILLCVELPDLVVKFCLRVSASFFFGWSVSVSSVSALLVGLFLSFVSFVSFLTLPRPLSPCP